MRIFSAFLFFFLVFPQAFSQELSSTVYECHFLNNFITTQSLRMKDYFDTQQGQRLGKIDLLDNLNTIESTSIVVYQIPFWDQQMYVQIWYSPNTRIDAQMSLNSSNKKFHARYHKGSLQQDLLCSILNP